MNSASGTSGPDVRLSALLPGFAPFAARTTRVHVLGYATGLLVWFVTYALTAHAATGTATTVVGEATIAAAAVTSVYFVAAIAFAVGSPLGNLAAPALITVGTPGILYRALAPSTLPGLSAVVPFSATGGTALGGVVAALVVSACGTAVVYHRKADRREWEREMMARSFSFLRILGLTDEIRAQGDQVRSNEDGTRASERDAVAPERANAGRLLGTFLGLLVLFSVVLAMLPADVAVRPNDVAGLLLVTTILAYVWLQ